MESIGTYATYELINVFCFFILFTLYYHFHTANIMAQLSLKTNSFSREPDYRGFRPGKIQTRLLVYVFRIAGTTLYKQQKYVYADQITQRGSAITLHSNGHTVVIRLCGCPIFLFCCFTRCTLSVCWFYEWSISK